MNLRKIWKSGWNNPITTWAGVATALTTIAINFLYLVDGNSETNPDAETIGLAVIGIFIFVQGFVSRDADKTSEETIGE